MHLHLSQVEIKGAVPRSELPALEVSRADSDAPKGSEIEMAPAMASNKILDLNEAEVLDVATPGSLCLPKIELKSGSQASSMAETQQTGSSENMPSCISRLPPAGVPNFSSDSKSQCAIREASSESASSLYGLPSANLPNVSSNPSFSESVMRGASSNLVQGRKPTWLNSFKEWLPEFLIRVSMRLKDGEWYPLSSLKGDYRAICGLELDHASLGFEKLSDFVRSFPELCRMKIVPVGRGPATHMVLLPPLTRNIPPSAAGRRSLSNITTRSLVDGTRSYAEVACHGSAARLGRSDGPQHSNPAFCTSGSNLGHQGTRTGAPTPTGEMASATDHQPAFSYGLHQGLSLRENGLRSCTPVAGDNAGLTAKSNGPPKTSFSHTEGHKRSDLNNGTPTTSNSNSSSGCRSASYGTLGRTDDAETLSPGETCSSDTNPGLSREEVAQLQELMSRLMKSGIEHAPPRIRSGAVVTAPVMKHDARLSPPRIKAPPGQESQKAMKNVGSEGERSIYFGPIIEQEPKTPTRENNLSSTPFNHPFAGFLSENLNPSMWAHDADRIKVGGYGIQSTACQFYEV